MSEAKRTTDRRTIQSWVEARGGRPSTVKGTGNANDAGLLRIDFGEPDEALEAISWDDFFRKFEQEDLEFLYQDKTDGGGESRFNKFVNRGE